MEPGCDCVSDKNIQRSHRDRKCIGCFLFERGQKPCGCDGLSLQVRTQTRMIVNHWMGIRYK